jgi:ATP-dependent Clp protease protease subunit
MGADSSSIILSKDNTIVLSSPVDDMSAAKVIQEARQLDASLKSGYPIVLVLNTPGGSIQAGLELIEALKSLNRPVQTLTIFAASMGFQIAQHLDQRNIIQYGVLMSHKAFGGFEGEFGGDGLSQLDSRYGFWLKRIKTMDEQAVKRTKGKQTLKSYRAAYENELWLSGEESVSQGYADKVVNARCDSSLNGSRFEEVSFFGMTFKIEFSTCPLITAPLNISVMVHTSAGAIPMSEFLQKGGLMGVECPQSTYSSYSSSVYGPVSASEPKQVLCALDKNLTVEKIQAEKAKISQEYTMGSKKRTVVLKP